MTEIRDEFRVLPGESPEEYAARTDRILEQRAREREESARRRREGAAAQERRRRRATAEESTRAGRLRIQGRRVERAIEDFEAEKESLYRKDGAQRFGEEEHAERLERLTSELREKIEAISREAEEDAQGYEREAGGLSYHDPIASLTAGERSRLESSRLFVSEDCERLSVEDLTERLKAVTEGDDKVAKVLHARYGRFRLEAMQDEADRIARERRADPRAAEKARDRRQLAEALDRLEEGLQDRTRVERSQKLTEAAQRSRQVATAARQRLREDDGTDEAARTAAKERIQKAF